MATCVRTVRWVLFMRLPLISISESRMLAAFRFGLNGKYGYVAKNHRLLSTKDALDAASAGRHLRTSPQYFYSFAIFTWADP